MHAAIGECAIDVRGRNRRHEFQSVALLAGDVLDDELGQRVSDRGLAPAEPDRDDERRGGRQRDPAVAETGAPALPLAGQLREQQAIGETFRNRDRHRLRDARFERLRSRIGVLAAWAAFQMRARGRVGQARFAAEQAAELKAIHRPPPRVLRRRASI